MQGDYRTTVIFQVYITAAISCGRLGAGFARQARRDSGALAGKARDKSGHQLDGFVIRRRPSRETWRIQTIEHALFKNTRRYNSRPPIGKANPPHGKNATGNTFRLPLPNNSFPTVRLYGFFTWHTTARTKGYKMRERNRLYAPERESAMRWRQKES